VVKTLIQKATHYPNQKVHYPIWVMFRVQSQHFQVGNRCINPSGSVIWHGLGKVFQWYPDTKTRHFFQNSSQDHRQCSLHQCTYPGRDGQTEWMQMCN